jgi:hypothetical protein
MGKFCQASSIGNVIWHTRIFTLSSKVSSSGDRANYVCVCIRTYVCMYACAEEGCTFYIVKNGGLQFLRPHFQRKNEASSWQNINFGLQRFPSHGLTAGWPDWANFAQCVIVYFGQFFEILWAVFWNTLGSFMKYFGQFFEILWAVLWNTLGSFIKYFGQFY